MSRLLGSTGIDVEHQFSVFEGTPPLFCQAPDIVDQTGQVILVVECPLFFHAVLETGDIEALVGLHVVENSVAASKKTWLAEYKPEDTDGGELDVSGRVMEMLSEHTSKAGSKPTFLLVAMASSPLTNLSCM
jgi:hypothetical protein